MDTPSNTLTQNLSHLFGRQDANRSSKPNAQQDLFRKCLSNWGKGIPLCTILLRHLQNLRLIGFTSEDLYRTVKFCAAKEQERTWQFTLLLSTRRKGPAEKIKLPLGKLIYIALIIRRLRTQPTFA